MRRKFIAYWFITILFEITSAALFRFTFGDVHARAPYLIYEITETTEIPLQVLEVRIPVPETRKVVYVIVEVTCAGIPPTVRFNWSRNKVTIRYEWFQVQEIYKYRVSASGVAVHYGSLETKEVTKTEVPEVYDEDKYIMKPQ